MGEILPYWTEYCDLKFDDKHHIKNSPEFNRTIKKTFLFLRILK